MAGVQYSEDLFISQDSAVDKESPTLNVEKNSKESDDNLTESAIQKEVDNCENTDTPLIRESNVSCGNEDPSSHGTVSREIRLSLLPFARIKQLMKLDCEINVISAEAIFVVTKATELFVQTLAKDACGYTIDSKKKSMSKADVEKTIGNTFSLKFLEGMMNL